MSALHVVQTLAAATVLVLAFTLLVSRTPEASVGLYAWASMPQAAVAVALAASLGRAEMFADAAAILAVKGLWAPRLLRRAVRHRGEIYGVQATHSAPALFVGAAAVTLTALWACGAIVPGGGVALGLAVGAMFTAFGAAAVRAELWCQAAGMLMGEAALATAALLLARGLPPGGEAFALAEVVVLAGVLAAAARLVDAAHGAPDARLLRGLRG